MERSLRYDLSYDTKHTTFLLGVDMKAKFDIFKKLPDGHPLWIKAVEELEEAKEQLAQLAELSPGEYFIYSARKGLIVETRMASAT
jgi:hypothetical protein